MINLLFLALMSIAKPIKIAVIDSGLNQVVAKDIPVCQYYDLTGTGFNDNIGHGTNVSGLIHGFAKNKDYCQVIIKVFDPATKDGFQHSLFAFDMISRDPDIVIVNYSAGGGEFNSYERDLIMKILGQGKIFVSAAGNNSQNLDKMCNYYPACYSKKIITVGNLSGKKRNKSSNYGKYIRVWEDGTDAYSYGVTMSGTSQATAIHTGKLVRFIAADHRIAQSNEYETAAKVTIGQLYRTEGVDIMVKNRIEYYKEKVPDYIRRPMNSLTPIIDTLVNQRLVWKYEF